MSKELKFAIKLAKKAGDYAIKNMDKIQKTEAKDGIRSIATNVDIEIEEMIVSSINDKFPQHGIIREEGDDKKTTSDYVWTVDPIDGTRYFEKGIKLFSVSIGLWHKNKPFLGVVYAPGAKDCYWAEKGGGAFYNGRKIKVSSRLKLCESIISFSIGKLHRIRGDAQKILFDRVEKIIKNTYRFNVLSSTALSLCFLAQGHFDAHFDLTGKENIWDVGAGVPIACEAGAKITGLDGKFSGMNANNLLITNGKIHNELLRLLNS